MEAYKFRSASQIAFALDIIINQRLFCADWRELNDPTEGIFASTHLSSDKNGYEKEIQEIREARKQLRVCSLSTTYNSHLLWAHYAGAFDGCAIKIELPENCHSIKKIEYEGVFAHIAMQSGLSAEDHANRILHSKSLEWSYEQEIRILQNDKWFYLDKSVKEVIVGHRMPEALFEAMNIICTSKGIKFSKIGIGDEGLDTDFVEPFVANITNLKTCI